jgi:hypothetical protein
MCRKRRGKKAALSLGVGLPATIVTAASVYSSLSNTSRLADLLTALTRKIPDAVNDIASNLIKLAGTQAIEEIDKKLAATANIPGVTATYGQMPVTAFGEREATLQLTFDSGDWSGNKAAKFDYAECNNNVFLLFKSEQKINIVGK